LRGKSSHVMPRVIMYHVLFVIVVNVGCCCFCAYSWIKCIYYKLLQSTINSWR